MIQDELADGHQGRASRNFESPAAAIVLRHIPMITVRLIGGLGNQMFQYAAARRLAFTRNVAIELDISGFRDYRLHQGFRLKHLSLPNNVFLRSQDKTNTVVARTAEWLARHGLAVLPGYRRHIVKERHFHFDPAVLDLGDDVYLDGYWQSPKYFADIEDVIRAEFKVRDPLTGRNLEVARRIGNCASVSLHVRRGDYVSNPTTNLFHGTCSPEYYKAAEEEVRSRHGDVQLFVFSDDPDWADANLCFRSPAHVVRHNGPEGDYEDLRLMSLCQHHIIANSTFSWWAAWLCEYPQKTVVAPRNWFRESGHRADDLIPQGWMRL